MSKKVILVLVFLLLLTGTAIGGKINKPLGITYDQVLPGLEFFNVKEVQREDGQEICEGRQEGSILRLIGDKKNLSKIELKIQLPDNNSANNAITSQKILQTFLTNTIPVVFKQASLNNILKEIKMGRVYPIQGSNAAGMMSFPGIDVITYQFDGTRVLQFIVLKESQRLHVFLWGI
ncbi:MAG: hypothetical protein NT178_17460 [Proteobacteria bacterium]|nr:hypothetical protein [Pseudomonadota bacterium]